MNTQDHIFLMKHDTKTQQRQVCMKIDDTLILFRSMEQNEWNVKIINHHNSSSRF